MYEEKNLQFRDVSLDMNCITIVCRMTSIYAEMLAVRIEWVEDKAKGVQIVPSSFGIERHQDTVSRSGR
jgi:hypothetical protein